MNRINLKFDKPVYVGQAILDLSKTVMYDFYYNTIKSKYGSDSLLFFKDTDSLCYYIRTPDFYRDLNTMKMFYDTSNYPKEHFLHDTTNKNVLAKMKDETAGMPIKEFVELRSKLYAYTVGDVDEKRAKGVAKNVVKITLQIEDYKKVLMDGTRVHRRMQVIASNRHETYTMEINKYGWSMSQYLPTSGFKRLARNKTEISVKPLDAENTFSFKVCNLNIPDFELHVADKYHKRELADYDDIEPKSDNKVCNSDWNYLDIEKFGVMSIDDDSSKGYILKVDLEYPKELHDLHNDFPLAPESIELDGSKFAKTKLNT